MACNRMFILCKKCNDAFCVGKTNNAGYYGTEREDFGAELREFYDRHGVCGDSFKIVYESAENAEDEMTNEQWEKWKNENET